MALNRYRTGFVADAADGAELTLELAKSGRWKVFYTPSEEALSISRNAARGRVPRRPILLMEGGDNAAPLTTYPLNTTATSPGFLRPKYPKLKSITFEDFNVDPPDSKDAVVELMEGFPIGLVTNPFFGLGLRRELRYLIDAIERSGATDLRIVWRRMGTPQMDGRSYVLSRGQFDKARRQVSTVHSKALRVAADEKRVRVHNQLLTGLDKKRFPEQRPTYRKDAIVNAVGRSPNIGETISPADQAVVLDVAKAAARQAGQREPHALMALQEEIELVTLKTLIERFRDLLGAKRTEAHWQHFLVQNPFILYLAFGYPIAFVGQQVSVGGRSFARTGDKWADLVAKTVASGNMALIEIKTAETDLLDKRPYRDGLYAPSRELSAAVSQVLDQRYQLQKNIQNLKDNSGEWDLQTYAVQCLVIAGRTPRDTARQKSLELYRNSLTSVSVVTYQEMLQKLEALYAFLAPAEAS